MNSRTTSADPQRRRIHTGTTALLGAALAACSTTGGFHGPPAPFLERSWVAPSLDKRDSLLYEAQIATNIFLYDDLVERQRDLRDDKSPTSVLARRLIVVPMFRVRQLSDSSAAVRTPSFMPSVLWEWHALSADTTLRTPGSTQRELKAIRDIGFRLGWNHHSNGQAGCFRSGYVPDLTGDPDNCIPGPLADTTGVGLNRASGDFSTSYWSGTLFGRRIAADGEHGESSVIEGALSYQYHRFGLFGDMRPEQRALYGTHRWRLDAGARRTLGPVQARIDVQAERAEKTDARITRWRGHVDLSVRAPRLLGAGAFVRFLDGQDYYNIGFANRRSRILLGLVLDPSALELPR